MCHVCRLDKRRTEGLGSATRPVSMKLMENLGDHLLLGGLTLAEDDKTLDGNKFLTHAADRAGAVN